MTTAIRFLLRILLLTFVYIVGVRTAPLSPIVVGETPVAAAATPAAQITASPGGVGISLHWDHEGPVDVLCRCCGAEKWDVLREGLTGGGYTVFPGCIPHEYAIRDPENGEILAVSGRVLQGYPTPRPAPTAPLTPRG